MNTISSQIIEAMPIGLINEFRAKALCLMSGLIEEMEMRFDTLTTEEVNFFKALQSINGDQERFNGMCAAFGKLMYAHQVIEDWYDMAEFQSSVQNQVRSGDYDTPWGQE